MAAAVRLADAVSVAFNLDPETPVEDRLRLLVEFVLFVAGRAGPVAG